MRPDFNDIKRLVLGCLLYTAGSAILYVFPAYLSDLGVRLGIDEARMGEVSAVENLGIGLASLLSVLWIGRVDRRIAAVAAAIVCAVANLLAFLSRSFELVLAARFLTGFLGEGPLFVMAFLALRATRDPDRSLGVALTAVVMFGSLVLGAAPYLKRIPLGSGVVLPLAAVALAVVFTAGWMPGHEPPAADEATLLASDEAGTGYRAFAAIVAMTVWCGAPGAFWTFAVDAATARQVSMADISIALAIGNAAGLLGSVLAAWQGSRWGRLNPILAATLCLVLSVVAFQYSVQLAMLTAALGAFNIFWNYGTVYQMALVVALDRTGRATACISAAQVIGFAAGGFVSGFAVVAEGFPALTGVVAAFAIAGLALFGFCFLEGAFGHRLRRT